MVIMTKKMRLRNVNLLIILIVNIVLNSCCFFPKYEFKKSDQRALFSADYNPDVNNKLKKGLYLIYDESCQKFLKGGGYILLSDGQVETTYFDLDYLDLADATLTNITNLINADLFVFGKFRNDGIYSIKDNMLLMDFYSVLQLNQWSQYKEDFFIRDEMTIIPVKDYLNSRGKDLVYRCIPLSFPITPSKRSCKKKKWMWSNKEDWKNFKSEQKNKDQ